MVSSNDILFPLSTVGQYAAKGARKAVEDAKNSSVGKSAAEYVNKDSANELLRSFIGF